LITVSSVITMLRNRYLLPACVWRGTIHKLCHSARRAIAAVEDVLVPGQTNAPHVSPMRKDMMPILQSLVVSVTMTILVNRISVSRVMRHVSPALGSSVPSVYLVEKMRVRRLQVHVNVI
jgi:hypothetical protein